MNSNEVTISREDKERVLTYIKEINVILDKYDYYNSRPCTYVTAMSRAKIECKLAQTYIKCLYVTPDDKTSL